MAKDKSIPKEWQLLWDETRNAIESGEKLEDFWERMEDHGFEIKYYRRDLGQEREVVIEVIKFFNTICDTAYKDKHPTSITNMIMARYREGYSIDTMKRVIKKLAQLWKGTSMHINLRPDIIFGPLKFSGYAGLIAASSRPASSSPSPKQTTAPKQTVKAQAPAPPKLSPQQCAERDVAAMSEWIETICSLDQKSKNVLLYIYVINLIWNWITDIKACTDQNILSKALQFAEQKTEEYKTTIADLDIEQSKETCRRYYILKSLFRGHTLTDLKSWPKPDHFINKY